MTFPSRDSILWWIGIVGGTCAVLAGHFDQFPWVPTGAQHTVELIGFVAAIISGKLATSPLQGASK